MKRAFRTTIPVLLFALLFLHCKEDVAVDFSDFTPKLVVNAQLTPAASFAFSIAESVSPVSDEPGRIPEGLQLQLTDLTLDLEISLYPENDLYIAPQIYPRPGHTYRIEASAPGFATVHGVTTIPRHQAVRTISVKNALVEPSSETEGKSNVSYDLEVMLDTDHGRYLHLTFWQVTRLNVGTVEAPDFEEFIYAVMPEFPEEDGFRKHHELGLLIDRTVLPEPERLSFTFRDYTINQFEELGDLIIEVRTTSPGYYRYFDSLARQLVSRQDPLAEPIPTYNNIESGLGNFSSFDYKQYRTDLFQ